MYELPRAHPDGLTPFPVAAAIAKGLVARKAIAFSRWLEPVHSYIENERAAIMESATWVPPRPLLIEPSQTGPKFVAYHKTQGEVVKAEWAQMSPVMRARLVLPGGGSPLLMLNGRVADGRPIVGDDTLDEAMSSAGDRCRKFWPDLDWTFQVHNGRHTYATELLAFFTESERHANEFKASSGRWPVWRAMARHDDSGLLVQDAMGHASFKTTANYAKTALFDAILRINADPAWNPALVGEPS